MVCQAIARCKTNESSEHYPRIGYGKVHVFNCLYNNNDYGIGLHSQCLVLAERNVFDRVESPIRQMCEKDPASEHHRFCESDEVDDVPAIVEAKVGPAARFGTLGPLPVTKNIFVTRWTTSKPKRYFGWGWAIIATSSTRKIPASMWLV